MDITRLHRVAGFVMLIALARPGVASPATITVLCSNGIRAVMLELVPEFERATGHSVAITYGLSADLKRQIDKGEPFDIAILTDVLIGDLIAQRKIEGATRAVLARSAIGLAIRAGATRPDIRTTDALKRTLRASTSIAFASEGAGGVFFTALMRQLGLVDDLKPRLRPTATGAETSGAVARGEVQLGVLPVSEILPVPGIEVLGTFPADVQGYTVMVAGINPGAAQRAAAGDLIKFLASAAALPVLKRKGMERD